MATDMQMDERIVDYLVLGPNTQDRKVLAKSVAMRATAVCKYLSGNREVLLKFWYTRTAEMEIDKKTRDILIHITLQEFMFVRNVYD